MDRALEKTIHEIGIFIYTIEAFQVIRGLKVLSSINIPMGFVENHQILVQGFPESCQTHLIYFAGCYHLLQFHGWLV